MAVAILITGYYRHPKMLRAGEAAEVLWARALDYCAEYGTDGHIPSDAPPALCPLRTRQRIAALVREGLWHPVEDGWQIHNYLKWNRSAAELSSREAAKHEKKVAAGRKGAEVRWGGRVMRPPSQRHSSGDSKPIAGGIANAWQSDGPGSGSGSALGLVGLIPPERNGRDEGDLTTTGAATAGASPLAGPPLVSSCGGCDHGFDVSGPVPVLCPACTPTRDDERTPA
jgi:hypothetical protein